MVSDPSRLTRGTSAAAKTDCPLPSSLVLNRPLKDLIVTRLLPRVQTPGQYVGGELNAVVKDHARLRGKLCLAFPDAYTIGMSYHGLQVLYHLMNRRDDWACERVFAPASDMEALLRQHGLPLYSLETFTPLRCFDVLGFTLQHELTYTNVLTILDLAGIPLLCSERTLDHPLVIAGGPCAANPEPMSRFIDLFVIGDGEEILPAICDAWLRLRRAGGDRPAVLAAMAAELTSVYVPQCYEPACDPIGPDHRARAWNRGHPGDDPARGGRRPGRHAAPHGPRGPLRGLGAGPDRDRDHARLPVALPLLPKQGDQVAGALPASGDDRPGRVGVVPQHGLQRDLALVAFHQRLPAFRGADAAHAGDFPALDVGISVPSLRINEQLRTISDVLDTDRHSGLTLAPEAARDELRLRIGKTIRNDDLYEGCRRAFENGFHRVKLYFLCGLPGEGPADLDGIIDMAEEIARLGKQIRGRTVTVVANVSNFVPKPHTPLERVPMQRREYFREAHEHLRRRRVLRSVQVKCHDVEASLLEAVLARGDRRAGVAIELAWRRGARFDSWMDRLRPELWWPALAEAGIDVEQVLHSPYPEDAPLPWDHIGKKG